MTVSRQDAGRVNQKARTRRAIIDAAAELAREHRSPTVAEAAERALVSRATAYRYFPSQQSLLVELQADATQPDPHVVLPAAGPDARSRVEAMVRTITRMVLADEPLFRHQIRLSQDTWFSRDGDAHVPVREGRRLSWIDIALAPLKDTMPAPQWQQVRTALCAVVGVEPVLSLRDICGLDAQAIEDTLVWAALGLLDSATR